MVSPPTSISILSTGLPSWVSAQRAASSSDSSASSSLASSCLGLVFRLFGFGIGLFCSSAAASALRVSSSASPSSPLPSATLRSMALRRSSSPASRVSPVFSSPSRGRGSNSGSGREEVPEKRPLSSLGRSEPGAISWRKGSARRRGPQPWASPSAIRRLRRRIGSGPGSGRARRRCTR